MLADFKKIVNPVVQNLYYWVKNNESDIILTIGIVLISLISFGAGQLTAPQSDIEPIVIQNPSASIIQSAESVPVGETTKEQGKFVGSINSSKYHWPECPWAKKIGPQNQIWFGSEAEAQASGYTPCGSFERYGP